ncbi:DUF418 domain-containing protein [Nocardiopsis ganjiahuensis]|uniref:DUF418 domain-containing protein n=1 Tax=Nocardiopsis ganjiahuensis TaxID=239984 RepID=UPI0003475F3C|nr:DUF418 domain-containing protein [Nocardiopsis ganjiahuensis]
MQASRLLAPDFARGGMLLLILLSNSAFFLYAGAYTLSGDYPDPASAADSVTQFLMLALLDVRIYPLFAFLVGYGMVQTLTRRTASGADRDEAARTVQSRNRWLFAFGFVHALLLLGTEVLAAYGIIGLVLCALFLRGSDRRLRGGILTGIGLLTAVFAVAAVVLAAIVLVDPAGGAAGAAAAEEGNRSQLSGAAEDNYLVSVLYRLGTWFVLLFINGFGVVLPTAILIGMWAARNRILEEPERHRTLIRRVAVFGTALGLAGALPGALKHVGAFDPASFHGLSDLATTMTAWTSGLAGGLGYVALFVLAAGLLTRQGRPPVVVASVAALGKRSLSGYLTHSIVMVPVLSAWGLGLGAHLTSFTMALFALGLWLATVVVAALMERWEVRGPFEVLLRRLSTRKPDREPTAS